MKAAIIATAALLAASPAWAQAQQQPQYPAPQATTAPATAEEFVRHAIQDNIGDVALNRLARDNPDTPQSVRQLADRITRDNIQFNGELALLAQAQGVTVSNELLDRDRQALDRLSALRGEDFTAAYLSHLVTELERDLERYRQAAQSIDTPEIRQFAAATAPRIQQHLQTARAVHDAQTAATPQQR